MTQRGILADPWFCFVTTPMHPAENSTIRNLLYPAIGFGFMFDATNRDLVVRMGPYWTLEVTAPDGQTLTTGAYSTAKNDGTALHFSWDKGDCGTTPEVGSFEILDLTWDATNKLTTGAINVEHHCGDSSPLYGRLRAHSMLPP